MRSDARIAIGIVFGFLIGSFSPLASITKLHFSCTEDKNLGIGTQITQQLFRASSINRLRRDVLLSNVEIYVPTNPKGAERLPPGIIVSDSDFYLHKLWGDPSKDLPTKGKYLVTFTVGYDQKSNIDAAVKKFSENFTILLFHYDGRINEWDEFEWSKRAIHVSAVKQTKWWYAKRFLHPDIVAPYEYIFIWDEDLGLEHFEAERYIEMVKKHELEISQPGLESALENLTWQMTGKRDDHEVHKETEEKPGRCTDPHLPPCAAFVEIMAPVFSRDAWRCVWHMIQNDLIHGWGLDFAFRKCVKGLAGEGKAPWEGVRERCIAEWEIFVTRMDNAEEGYYKNTGIKLSRKGALAYNGKMKLGEQPTNTPGRFWVLSHLVD